MTLGKFGEGLHALFSCCGFCYLPPGHFSDSSSSRSRTPDHGIIDEEQSESSNGSQISHFPDKWASLKVCYSDIEEATNGLNEALKIGKGGYGSVYKGKLGRNDVAIKILDSTSNQGQKEFFQELKVLHEMRHPNLVKLVGACLESRALVYEYLPHGSLEDFLKENPSLLTWKMRTRIIYEICSALIYLHSRSVVHGDLKPANILLDANFKSKLSDFGLCRFLPKDMTTSVYLETIPKGTSGYIDPWFLETWILRPGSDLYSFGITILKLLTGLPPVGLGIKARDTDENSFREMIDSTAGIWPFERAKELLYWSLQCCYHNEYQKSLGLLKDMSTCLEDMLAEIESLQEGGFKVVMRGQRTLEAEDTDEEPEAEVIMVVKIHMHNATYAQEIKERILRMKGVQTAETELESSLVLVNGAFDPSKLVEYAYRMTGKRPLIVKVLPVAEYDQRIEPVAKSVGWKTVELQRISASDSVWKNLDCTAALLDHHPVLHRLSDRRTVTHTMLAEWLHTSASDSLENNHPLERCDSLDSSHRSSAADDDSDAVELDAKADGFIARFREQIRLQRIQSIHDDIVF